jgi:hypothetical protein
MKPENSTVAFTGPVLDRAVAAGLIHRHHVMRPEEQLLGHVGGNAEQIADHDHRNGGGEVGYELGLALLFNAVDQAIGKAGDRGAQAFHLARQEGAVDEAAEPPQPGVDGRLEFQQRMRFEVVEGLEMRGRCGPAQLLARCHMQDLAAEAAVPQKGVHILVPGEAPDAILLPFEHRSPGADRVIGRIGIAGRTPDRQDRGKRNGGLHQCAWLPSSREVAFSFKSGYEAAASEDFLHMPTERT